MAIVLGEFLKVVGDSSFELDEELVQFGDHQAFLTGIAGNDAHGARNRHIGGEQFEFMGAPSGDEIVPKPGRQWRYGRHAYSLMVSTLPTVGA
jgi:hypothetical protein